MRTRFTKAEMAMADEVTALRDEVRKDAGKIQEYKALLTDANAALSKQCDETEAALRRAADAENRVDHLTKDLNSARVQLETANDRIGDLHAKVRERENAIVALGIRLGEMKLNESYGGTGR